jgi:TPR repeat protein
LRAAESGDAVARYVIGVRYLDGEGVRRDNLRAFLWLNLAVAGGIEQASGPRADAVARMTTVEMETALGLGRAAP